MRRQPFTDAEYTVVSDATALPGRTRRRPPGVTPFERVLLIIAWLILLVALPLYKFDQAHHPTAPPGVGAPQTRPGPSAE